MQIAQDNLASSVITRFEYNRQQERIHLAECSWRWGHDIWIGQDRDYLGNITGSGDAKLQCACCSRLVPPQDLVNMHRWPPRPEIQGPPPQPRLECTDCRTIAPRQRAARDRRRTRTTRSAKFIKSCDDVWCTVEDEYELPGDSSPMTPALAAMALANDRLPADGLPTEDEADLAAAIARFNQSNNLAEFQRATGEAAAEETQLRRRAAMAHNSRGQNHHF